MLLEDQTAIITGAASGIGRSAALAFAVQGADVVVADRRERPRSGRLSTPELIAQETDATAVYVRCDVAEPSTLDAAFESATELGGLDVMVNNAGTFHHGDPLETSLEEYNDVFDVNVKGTFFGTQKAGRLLANNGGGVIVNVASTSAFDADGAIAAYSASKAAIVQTTRAFADALGSNGVRINAVCPGSIETGLSRDRSDAEQAQLLESIPLHRIGTPEDVADALVFLASDRSAYITGETLVVDGGLTL